MTMTSVSWHGWKSSSTASRAALLIFSSDVSNPMHLPLAAFAFAHLTLRRQPERTLRENAAAKSRSTIEPLQLTNQRRDRLFLPSLPKRSVAVPC